MGSGMEGDEGREKGREREMGLVYRMKKLNKENEKILAFVKRSFQKNMPVTISFNSQPNCTSGTSLKLQEERTKRFCPFRSLLDWLFVTYPCADMPSCSI